jgi:hypothetical protein
LRILFDECTSRPLVLELTGLDVVQVLDLGWQGRKNGVLLASMQSEGFTVFSTVDGNLRYQQKIAASGVAMIVLEATTNQMSDVPPLMPRAMPARVTGSVVRQ